MYLSKLFVSLKEVYPGYHAPILEACGGTLSLILVLCVNYCSVNLHMCK
jgi:hypothetical protein